ncbi:MAG: WG repeat-containing protein [Lachnospiraceae bacterium]
MDENQKKGGRLELIVIGILFAALLFCLVMLTVLLIRKGKLSQSEQQEMGASIEEAKGSVTEGILSEEEQKLPEEEEGKLRERGVYSYETRDWETGEKINVRKVSFCITDKVCENAYIADGPDGKCGLINAEGRWLVPPEYEYVSHYEEAWICFEKADGYGYVFNMEGIQLYQYLSDGENYVTEDGTEYNRTSYYRHGMRIDLDLGIVDNLYYGAHYYNAETGELIFELAEHFDSGCVTAFPDETGTAVVVTGKGYETTVYTITLAGYRQETFEENIALRQYYFSNHISWRRSLLSDGWLRTQIMEYRGELFDYSTEWKEVLYNIKTKEIVPLPEKYQGYSQYYWKFHGLYYGITQLTEEEYYNGTSGNVYYALCCGSKVLTEEIYRWFDFGEKYIIAGNGTFSHILDYEGNVLAEYVDVAEPFDGDRTLVYDGEGMFFLNEKLEQCSDYIMTGKRLSYCEPRMVVTKDSYYFIQWLPEQKEK